MTDELIALHGEILSEFEKRIESNDEIPGEVVNRLKEAENLGLDSSKTLRDAIEESIEDEST